MKVIRALRNSVADVNAPVTQDGYIHLMLASLWLKCTGGVADRIQSRCERRNQEELPLDDRRHLSIAELLLRSGGVTARSEDSRTALIIGPNIS